MNHKELRYNFPQNLSSLVFVFCPMTNAVENQQIFNQSISLFSKIKAGQYDLL